MKIAKSEAFIKFYQKLPKHIQKKVDKQLRFLVADIFYPSLRTKRMAGLNQWEARVDRSYRFTFDKENDTFFLRTVGPHDEGLGKK